MSIKVVLFSKEELGEGTKSRGVLKNGNNKMELVVSSSHRNLKILLSLFFLSSSLLIHFTIVYTLYNRGFDCN